MFVVVVVAVAVAVVVVAVQAVVVLLLSSWDQKVSSWDQKKSFFRVGLAVGSNSNEFECTKTLKIRIWT